MAAIELVSRRIRELLRIELPGEIETCNDFWSQQDLSFYGRAIEVRVPRDDGDNVNLSYFIGEPTKIADFPAIVIRAESSYFSANASVTKEGFQSETVKIAIKIFTKMEHTNHPEDIEIASIRLTDCVIAILRHRPHLQEMVYDSDPITKSFGLSGVRYFPYRNSGRDFFSASELNLEYKLTDSTRNKPYYV